jgi:hypothetical protein
MLRPGASSHLGTDCKVTSTSCHEIRYNKRSGNSCLGNDRGQAVHRVLILPTEPATTYGFGFLVSVPTHTTTFSLARVKNPAWFRAVWLKGSSLHHQSVPHQAWYAAQLLPFYLVIVGLNGGATYTGPETALDHLPPQKRAVQLTSRRCWRNTEADQTGQACWAARLKSACSGGCA